MAFMVLTACVVLGIVDDHYGAGMKSIIYILENIL